MLETPNLRVIPAYQNAGGADILANSTSFRRPHGAINCSLRYFCRLAGWDGARRFKLPLTSVVKRFSFLKRNNICATSPPTTQNPLLGVCAPALRRHSRLRAGDVHRRARPSGGPRLLLASERTEI